jgi:protein involved in polysaccharide export with SLBB domain
MKLSLTAVVAFIAVLFCLNAPAQSNSTLKATDPVKIELKVPAEDAANVTGTYTVSEKGLLKMPYLNSEIQASGLTVSELSRKIEAAYKTESIYTNPTVIVSLQGIDIFNPHVVVVGGEVRKTGEVPMRENMRLYAAIMAAGGFTEFADVRHVKVIRGTTEKVYNMRKIDNDSSPLLKDGDQIVVPQD